MDDQEVKYRENSKHTSTKHQERYLHFMAKDGIVGKIKAVTVYARFEPAREYLPEGWYGEMALCVQEDQFSRKIGRQVARRKYLGGLQNRCRGYRFLVWDYQEIKTKVFERVVRENLR